MVQPAQTPDFTSGIPLLIGIFSEVLMGLGIGLCVKLIFVGVQLGGELAGFQMGLSMANVFDPGSGTSNSVVAQFKYIVAVLIFLSIDGHHWFFRAIMDSFSLMPPFGFVLTESLMGYFLALVGKMFMISVKLSSPVIVALLFTSVSLGLVARTVPQMNVFFVAMPIKLFIGFLFIGLMLPIFSSLLVKIFNTVGTIMLTFIKLGLN
jgi:flagellar biosynthetic protein FliR